MIEIHYYIHIILILTIAIIGAALLRNDKKNQSAMIERQNLLAGYITQLQKKVDTFEETLGLYRKTYLEHIESYNQAQEHMAKTREQMQMIRRGVKVLRDNMVKRYEINLPNDFKAHMKKIAAKLDELT